MGVGGHMPATRNSADVCTTSEYIMSPLERSFMVDTLATISNSTTNCDKLGDTPRKWIIRNLDAGEATDDDTAIFSTICKSGSAPQVIEPLAGILRDPRQFCDNRDHVFSIDWLVFADNRSYATAPGAKKILFDAGGTRFMDAMKFLVSKYEERGLVFDKIYVWEARKQPEEHYWAGVPRGVQAKWKPKLRFYNGIPIVTDVGRKHNPMTRIYNECGPNDFCAFKLDIDTPSVEMRIVEQVRASPGHLKEFFFEHHVHGLMQGMGWGDAVSGTFVDSYNIFHDLRRKGVRAHSWI